MQRASREPGLLEQVATAAAEDHPLALLGLASGLLNALGPRSDHPFNRQPVEPVPPLGELPDACARIEDAIDMGLDVGRSAAGEPGTLTPEPTPPATTVSPQ